MAAIALENVSKTFADGSVAVNNASFTINEGEFFVLVGPSGCGKSTLLNLVVGLEGVSDGLIRIDGRVVNDLDPKDRNMAMVFQHYAIYPHMSVRENLAFPLTLAKLPRAEIQRRVQEAAQLLELTPLLDRRPATLSGGQRQRVAMGRAMVRQPAAFLMDEPLSNLDAKLRVQMRHEIAQLQRRLQTTTLYVTHDQTEAMILADRVAVLNQGVIQQIGTPRQLYDRPANCFVAEFIGTPAMNMLPGTVRDGVLRLPMLDIPVAQLPTAPTERQSLLVGIRPEHLTAAPSTPTQLRFTVRIEMLDWRGADGYAWFTLPATGEHGRQRGVARIPPDTVLARGDALELSLEPRHLHLFNADSGVRA